MTETVQEHNGRTEPGDPVAAATDGEPTGQAVAEGEGEAAPVAVAAEEGIPALVATQQELVAQMRALAQDFAAKLKYDQAKERTIDLLHQEVLQHRQGLHLTLLRPLFTDLIALHDDLAQLAEIHAGSDDSALATTAQNLASFVTTVEEILARNNVEAYSSAEDTFDGKRQRVVQTIATDLPEQAGRVAQRLSKGFAYDGRILRPELVTAYAVVVRA